MCWGMETIQVSSEIQAVSLAILQAVNKSFVEMGGALMAWCSRCLQGLAKSPHASAARGKSTPRPATPAKVCDTQLQRGEIMGIQISDLVVQNQPQNWTNWYPFVHVSLPSSGTNDNSLKEDPPNHPQERGEWPDTCSHWGKFSVYGFLSLNLLCLMVAVFLAQW